MKDIIIVTGNKWWSTYYDGFYLQKNLEHKYNISLHDLLPRWVRNCLIYFTTQFGVFNSFYDKNNNIIVANWWHGDENSRDRGIQEVWHRVPDVLNSISIVISPNSLTTSSLIRSGITEEKIIEIPVGVDLEMFPPVRDIEEKVRLRRKWKVPENSYCIGSFQSDDGDFENTGQPKWLKGPDLWIECISKIAKKKNIFILLAGYKRNFVMRELKILNIPFMYHEMVRYDEMPELYKSIDAYLVTSRAEGGPKSIIESMASKVLILTFKVGLGADIEIEERAKLEIGNVDGLVEAFFYYMNNQRIEEEFKEKNLQIVKQYDHKENAKRFDDYVISKAINYPNA